MIEKLQALREEIDKIDEEVLELLGKRDSIISKVAAVKEGELKNNSYIMPEREVLMLKKLKQSSSINPELVEYLWRGIIANSLLSEKNFQIFYNKNLSEEEVTSLNKIFPHFIGRTNCDKIQIEENYNPNKDILVLSAKQILDYLPFILENNLKVFYRITHKNEESLFSFANIDNKNLAKDYNIIIGTDSDTNQDCEILYQNNDKKKPILIFSYNSASNSLTQASSSNLTSIGSYG